MKKFFKKMIEKATGATLITPEELSERDNKVASDAHNRLLEWKRLRQDNPQNIESIINSRGDGSSMFNVDGDTMAFWQNRGWFNFSESDLTKSGAKLSEADGTWSIVNSGSSRAQTSGVLTKTQNAAYAKYHTDPHVFGYVENLKNYVIGTGVSLYIPNEAISEYVTSAWKRFISPVQRRFVQSLAIDGEYFWLLSFEKELKDFTISRLYPSEILRVNLDENNRDLIESFEVSWRKSDGKTVTKTIFNIKHPKFKYSQKLGILFSKWGDGEEVRGVVPIETALRTARWAEDFTIDRVILNHERSRVVWIKNIKNKTSMYTTTGDAFPVNSRAPAAGVMLTEPPDVEYRTEKAEINAHQVKDDYMNILYIMSTAFGMPLDIWTQRANETVYASIKKSANSFHQKILSNRERLSESFSDILREVIKFGISIKAIPPKIPIPRILVEMESGLGELDQQKIKELSAKKVSIRTEDIVDYMIFIYPNVFTENSKEETEALVLQCGIGAVSVPTISEKLGYNFGLEIVRMVQSEGLIEKGEEEPKPKPTKTEKGKPKSKEKNNGQ